MTAVRGVGAGMLALLLFVAAFGPALVAADPARQSLSLALAAPGPGGLLGTDHLGRSELARVVHGARLSLAIAGLAVVLAPVSYTHLTLPTN